MRKAHVSPTGIVWWVDSPDGHVSHLQFALSPKDTPGEPATGFTGSIRLNALDLTPDTSEAVFLRHGGVKVQGHAHSWAYRTVDHYISFAFERRRNRVGKRSGVHKLVFVEIDFARGSEQPASGDAGGRVQETLGSAARRA